ncbi:hypothetical protein KB206_18815 [Microvirga sp. STS02]|uniref:hypothetical protein n=1 Tax=Hymenobacter negativus TaxID=2795026 RepID=UPI0018DD3C26|nr:MULTISPECIES: hypothetical protein [Bacteria]MBH8570951.1 hypothetical protein [Hymenobacter negativus]MBR7210689.1 hypothetical protein [Microvirga sp. STS02]
MTDRKPDDLYDALRDRLADYGQEPPAQLWAGIRSQLPPPVAAPQLRKRRRRVPAAWLLLMTLSVVALAASWHWWGAKQSTITASRTRQNASYNSSDNAAQTSAVSPQNATATSRTNPQRLALNTLPASPATAPRPTADAAAGPTAGQVISPVVSPGSIATKGPQKTPAAVATSVPTGAAVSAAAKAAVAASAARGASVGTTGQPVRSVAASSAVKELAANSARWNHSSPQAARGQARAPGKQAGSVASVTHHLPETTNPAVAQSGALRTGRNASMATITKSSQGRAASKKRLTQHKDQSAAALAAAATPSSEQPQSYTSPIADQPTRQLAPATAAISRAHPMEVRSQRAAQDLLSARLVAVQFGAGLGLPAPQPVAVVPSPLPLPFASRWAVQVVAGPAITYRNLNTATNLAASVTSPPTIVYIPNNNTATPVATLERPALGSAVQVAVRRTLGGHWSLSAGLGYAEYASALALQQVYSTTSAVANSPTPDSTGIHRRDTYRFVTVPVRVGYGWTLSGRWRVGLLAGAEAAVYVGGSSTEGSACACQSQTWGFSGSPYRRYSLGASLGAEARYRLSERWELLAQPTATYLFTPLANYTPYYQRHLFGGAALLGVSFNLL